MGSRVHERVSIRLEGELTSNTQVRDAFVGNISEKGIHARVPLHETDRVHGIDSNIIQFSLKIPFGDTVSLHCIKRWSHRMSPGSMIEGVGLEIIDPPTEFKEFLWVETFLSRKM